MRGGGSLTDVPGVRVGHWTDARARTGCTVALFPEGTVASGEVRGGAPATREFALLDPSRMVRRLDAVALCGGSAFGLAAADGVARWCEERGAGFPTVGGPVPIVVAMAIFDLGVGDPSVRPGPAEGYAACAVADDRPVGAGPFGAGCGATTGKVHGRERAVPGGIGSAAAVDGDLVVAALAAVNCYGDVVPAGAAPTPAPGLDPADAFEHTTIGVVATNATLDKGGCLLVAQGAHDGLARAIEPAHASVDGDAVVAAAVGGVDAHVDRVRALAAAAFAAAIRSAVR